MIADPLEHRYRVGSGNMELEHRRASLVEPMEENGQMSALGGKTVICRRKADIPKLSSTFQGKADVIADRPECLLIAKDRRLDRMDGFRNPSRHLRHGTPTDRPLCIVFIVSFR